MTVEQLYDKLADIISDGNGKGEIRVLGTNGSFTPDEVIVCDIEGTIVVKLREKED